MHNAPRPLLSALLIVLLGIQSALAFGCTMAGMQHGAAVADLPISTQSMAPLDPLQGHGDASGHEMAAEDCSAPGDCFLHNCGASLSAIAAGQLNWQLALKAELPRVGLPRLAVVPPESLYHPPIIL